MIGKSKGVEQTDIQKEKSCIHQINIVLCFRSKRKKKILEPKVQKQGKKSSAGLTVACSEHSH